MTSRANVERLAVVTRALRLERGLTMRGVARAAGIDVVYVSRVGSAAYDLPNPLYLLAITDALGISAMALLLAAGYLRPQDLNDQDEVRRESGGVLILRESGKEGGDRANRTGDTTTS